MNVSAFCYDYYCVSDLGQDPRARHAIRELGFECRPHDRHVGGIDVSHNETSAAQSHLVPLEMWRLISGEKSLNLEHQLGPCVTGAVSCGYGRKSCGISDA